MKRLLPLLVTIALLVTGTAYAQDSSLTDIEAVHEFIQNDFDTEYMIEDAVIYDNAYGISYEGADEIQTGIAPFYNRELFGDYAIEIESLTSPQPGRVIAQLNYTPDGAQSSIDIGGVFTLANQRIVYAVLDYDPTVLISEYGYLPPSDATEPDEEIMALLDSFENAPLSGTRLVPADGYELPDVEVEPSTYFGSILTLNGTIIEITSPGTFIMEDTFPQDLTGGDIVVYANDDTFEGMNVTVEEGQLVRVTGSFLGMDEATIERELAREIDPDHLGDFGGDDYAVLASSVYAAEEDHYESMGAPEDSN